MESIVTVLIALVAVEAGGLILNALIFSRMVIFQKKQEIFQERMTDKKEEMDRLNDMVYQLSNECFSWKEKYQALESTYNFLASEDEAKPKKEEENVVKEAKEEVPSKRTRKRTTTSRKKV